MKSTRLTPDEIRAALKQGGLEINLAGGTWVTDPQPIEGGDVLARRVDDDDEARLYDWHELASWLETLNWREQAVA